MAEKRMVTAVIDSIDERLPDNDRGWGKYRLFMEGMKGAQKVDVPADVNAEYDLEEGFTLTLVEGPYKGWIVHSKSECFTGEPFQEEAPQEAPRRAPKRTTAAPKSQGGAATRKSSGQSEERSTVATPKGGAHTSWNQYQIDVRDPQMRMQSLLRIVADVHCKCIEHNCDPGEAIAAIIADAEKLDKDVVKYLGL